MADLIDRDKLLLILKKNDEEYWNSKGGGYTVSQDIIDEIRFMPKVDTDRHAHWIKHKPNEEQMKAYHRLGFGKAMNVKSIYWLCSNCNGWGTPAYKYCPHCGCKMEDGE